jgi:hypothetical protein
MAAAKRSLLTALALVGVFISSAGTALGAPAQGTGLSGAAVRVSHFDDGSFEYPIARAGSFTTYQAGQYIGPWSVTSADAGTPRRLPLSSVSERRR